MHVGTMTDETLCKQLKRGQEAVENENVQGQFALAQLNERIGSFRDRWIYAFNPFPGIEFLKVGDTTRPSKRLEEWGYVYPHMNIPKNHFWSAWVNFNGTLGYVRDYSYHKAIKEAGYRHVQAGEMPINPDTGKPYYYSNEIFADITEEELSQIDRLVKKSIADGENKYSVYLPSGKKRDDMVPVVGPYDYRPVQQLVHNNFYTAAERGIKRMLMFAPPRFGKTFTALMIAKALRVTHKGKHIMVVSGKADVRNEWHDTVVGLRNFRDEEWVFLDSSDLDADHEILTRLLKEGKTVVVFCTLADLKGEDVKMKHRQLFENHLDFLIVDETHFGARAEEYGYKLPGADDIYEMYADIEAAQEASNVLHPDYELHLSGTPYRILMTNEFPVESVIYAARYTEMILLRDQWNAEHPEEPEEKNPYYGIPDMINLGFDLVDPASLIVQKMRKAGIASINELHAVYPKTGNFIHEDLVLTFWKAIDGSSSDCGVLGILSKSGIVQKDCGRHVVVVLPRCASCDALAELFEKHKDEFDMLSDYEVLNISSSEDTRDSDRNIKETISKAYRENRKTMTLTVNRMLTGSTVPEWDTMFYMKSGLSAQDYEQAKCRLLSPHVLTYEDADGNKMKIVQKPTTVFIDFDYGRMFEIEAQSIQTMQFLGQEDGYNGGVDALKKGFEQSAKAAPILLLHNVEEGFHEVTPVDFLAELAEYNARKGIMEAIDSLVVGFKDIDDEQQTYLSDLLSRQEIGAGAQNKLTLAGYEDGTMQPDGDELADLDPQIEDEDKESLVDDEIIEIGDSASSTDDESSETDQKKNFEKQYKSLCLKLLLFAFCTPDKVESITDIVKVSGKKDNVRILAHLGLVPKDVAMFKAALSEYAIVSLDLKILTVNAALHDEERDVVERVKTTLAQFTRLSNSEVVTPLNVAAEVVGGIDDKDMVMIADAEQSVLDFSSETAEMSVAIFQRLEKLGYSLGVIRKIVCALPASPIAYEMTRKVYDLLGLDIDNIYANFDVFDVHAMIEKAGYDYTLVSKKLCQPGKKMCQVKLDDVVGDDVNMVKFGAVVGNPPYQAAIIGKRNTAMPIYHNFMDLAYTLSDECVLITPARFLFNAGMTPKQWNQKMLNDPHLKVIKYFDDSSECFPSADLKGGVAITLRNGAKKESPIETFMPNETHRHILEKIKPYTEKENMSSIGHVPSKFNIDILGKDFPQYAEREKRISSGALSFDCFHTKPEHVDDIAIYGIFDSKRAKRYIARKYVETKDGLADKDKVIIPKAIGNGQLGETIPEPMVISAPSGYTHTFISFGGFDTNQEAEACRKYISTKFARSLWGILKVTQNGTKDMWKYVPIQDFTSNSDIDWSKSIAEIDAQLYKKYGLSKEEIAFIEKNIKPME